MVPVLVSGSRPVPAAARIAPGAALVPGISCSGYQLRGVPGSGSRRVPVPGSPVKRKARPAARPPRSLPRCLLQLRGVPGSGSRRVSAAAPVPDRCRFTWYQLPRPDFCGVSAAPGAVFSRVLPVFWGNALDFVRIAADFAQNPIFSDFLPPAPLISRKFARDCVTV